jgi:hypothetical protein
MKRIKWTRRIAGVVPVALLAFPFIQQASFPFIQQAFGLLAFPFIQS